MELDPTIDQQWRIQTRIRDVYENRLRPGGKSTQHCHLFGGVDNDSAYVERNQAYRLIEPMHHDV